MNVPEHVSTGCLCMVDIITADVRGVASHSFVKIEGSDEFKGNESRITGIWR